MDILWKKKISNVRLEEELCDGEMDLFSGAGEGMIGVYRKNHQRLERSHEEKINDVLPKWLVSNILMNEDHLDITHCSDIGKNCDIWNFCVDTFELGAVRIVQTHQLLYQMNIVIKTISWLCVSKNKESDLEFIIINK